MDVILYSAKGSNSSERVEWVLNYKQITYQRIEVGNEALAGSYLNINPFGYVHCQWMARSSQSPWLLLSTLKKVATIGLCSGERAAKEPMFDEYASTLMPVFIHRKIEQS
jgi:hypothetical protein